MSETRRGEQSPKTGRRRTSRAKRQETGSPEDQSDVNNEQVSGGSGAGSSEEKPATQSQSNQPLGQRGGERDTSFVERGGVTESYDGTQSQERGDQGQNKQGQNSSSGLDDSRSRLMPFDEYAYLIFYDRNQKQFVGSVVEYPEIKVTGASRQRVGDELNYRLEQHINNLRRRNETVTEPVFLKRYPDRLEVSISQSLYRKLDLLSRQEKVSLDQLVTELLSGGPDRRREPVRGRGQDRGQDRGGQDRGQDRRIHSQHDRRSPGNQRHPQQQQQRGNRGNRGNRRNYQETMDNRENFMEYVRSLEKGGGSGWRKK